MARLRRPAPKTLRAVHPNVGLTVEYRRRLLKLVDDMNASVQYWIKAAYRRNEPAMAMDATPAAEMQRAVRKMIRQWQRRFNKGADDLADFFAKAARSRSDRQLQAILRDAGFSVKFTTTPAMRDVMRATVEQNVQLIKSIPQQYLTQVQGAVMRSVQTGRDLASLADELQEQFGVTRRRAALIARDQNAKATSAMQKVRQVELGIQEGIWMHSHAGKVPRPTHLANDRKRFNIAEGWYDPDPKVRRHIMPGELINCFPASTKVQFADGVEKAFRHWYSGQLTEIISASGKSLRATPNHPILTPRGWAAIGALNEGDDVIELAYQGIPAIVPEGHEYDREPAITQIFDTLSEFGTMRFEVALRDDFHGDGAVDGNVDIVDAARHLFFGLHRLQPQRIGQLGFTVTNKTASSLCSLAQLGLRNLAASARLMRSLSEALAPTLSLAGHPNFIGVAAASRYPASSFNSRYDRVSRDPVDFGQGQDANSTLMLPTQTTRIAKINRAAYDGHVFNLQTADGWYSAEGIIVHNCRCTWKPIVPGFS